MRFQTPAPLPVALDIAAGRIRFVAADRADTVVEVLPVDATKSRDAKAAEQTRVEYRDGVLRIDGPRAKNQLLGPSVDITAGTGHGRVRNTLRNADGAAAGLTVHATTAYGDITARGL
ncbi:hypothetical protein [Streptomyces althioticus]|uniref:hypothetical protein n=1 Tax=Streptomyces althioticus TaxID=83380 RepID=UPI0037FF1418